MQLQGNESIHMLEALDLRVRTNHLLINVDWFRAIHHYDVPNHAWHEHTSMEMHFVVNGSVTFHLPDRTVDVMGGQAILIPANMPHKLQCLDHDPEQICIDLITEFLSDGIR